MQPKKRSSSPPLKRPRRAPSPTHSDSNGHDLSKEGPTLPPLSLSILGLEPLDEFIKEIADFVHHMIMTRPDQLHGKVEVEAKIGILHERMTGKRLALPVLVETSICCFPIRPNETAFVDWLPFFFFLFSLLRLSCVKSTVPRFYRRAIRVQYVNCMFRKPSHRHFKSYLISVFFFFFFSTNTNIITPSSIV